MKHSVTLCLILFFSITSRGFAACSGSSPKRIASAWTDVAACHSAARDGDTITVMPGTYVVDKPTRITKFVRIAASGVVTLVDNTPNQSNLIEIVESTAGSTRLEGFKFVQGTGIHPNPNGVIVMTNKSGGKPILITGTDYQVGTSGDFIIANVNRGVIWRNGMKGKLFGNTCSNNASFVRQKPQDGSWASPPKYGADDTKGDLNLYIETNVLTNVFEGVDVDDNGRAVIRHNTITNSGLLTHGADTGPIGGRYMDIYNNTFIWDATVQCPPDLPAGVNSFIYLRGGTALIHENEIPDVAGRAWGDKSEIGFTVEALGRNAGDYACWKGGYPAPHQPGWGYRNGGTRAGRSPIVQDLEPIYVWNNKGAGNHSRPTVFDYASGECGTGVAAATDYIRQNREYFLGVPKPGYAAYTYPHQLTADPQPLP